LLQPFEDLLQSLVLPITPLAFSGKSFNAFLRHGKITEKEGIEQAVEIPQRVHGMQRVYNRVVLEGPNNECHRIAGAKLGESRCSDAAL